MAVGKILLLKYFWGHLKLTGQHFAAIEFEAFTFHDEEVFKMSKITLYIPRNETFGRVCHFHHCLRETQK